MNRWGDSLLLIIGDLLPSPNEVLRSRSHLTGLIVAFFFASAIFEPLSFGEGPFAVLESIPGP